MQGEGSTLLHQFFCVTYNATTSDGRMLAHVTYRVHVSVLRTGNKNSECILLIHTIDFRESGFTQPL